MSCSIPLPLGASKCAANYGDPRMFVIATEPIVYPDYTSAQDNLLVKEAVQKDLTAIVTNKFNDLEVTASEEVSEENGYNEQVFIKNTPGSAIAYLSTNPIDFVNYSKSFKGGSYFIEILMVEGYKLLTRKPDGTLTGFSAKVNATPVGMPGLTDKNKQYKLNIKWLDILEFDSAELVKMVDSLSDYSELMPIAMKAEPQGAYASTLQTYFMSEATDRSVIAVGAYTARVLSSNVLVPAVMPAPFDAQGKSVVTITKDSSPVALTIGDWIKFRFEFTVSGSIEYISQDVTFIVQ